VRLFLIFKDATNDATKYRLFLKNLTDRICKKACKSLILQALKTLIMFFGGERGNITYPRNGLYIKRNGMSLVSNSPNNAPDVVEEL